MPAVSKKQQRYMGMVHAVQKGEMKAPSKAVADTAHGMKPSSAKHFAETKTKGLPEKKASVFELLTAVVEAGEKIAAFGSVMPKQALKPMKPAVASPAITQTPKPPAADVTPMKKTAGHLGPLGGIDWGALVRGVGGGKPVGGPAAGVPQKPVTPKPNVGAMGSAQMPAAAVKGPVSMLKLPTGGFDGGSMKSPINDPGFNLKGPGAAQLLKMLQGPRAGMKAL